jgi:hypothetical protein
MGVVSAKLGDDRCAASAGWRPTGAVQSIPPVLGMPVGLEPMLMDRDVMVVPAECDQIRRVGSAAVTPRKDVVDLEPASAVAAVDHAPVAITVNDSSAQRGWDGS